MADNELELIGTALQSFDRVSAGLALLEKNFKGMLYEVDKPIGMEHAKAARAAIREPRYEVERVRKSAKARLLALGKRLDAEATRISTALLVLESPIDEQIKSEEDRREREKQAKIVAEQQRVANIQARIEAIRMLPSHAIGKTPAEARIALDNAAAITIDESFAEFTAQANTALHTAIVSLQGIHAERVNFETEQERIRKERAELEVLRAEQEKRNIEDRRIQAQKDEEIKATREAAARAQVEEFRRQREENERIAAEHAAKAKAENDRLAAERLKIEAERAVIEHEQQAMRDRTAKIEADRLAAEREAKRKTDEQAAAELAAKQAARRKAPSATEIIAVLASHYKVPADKVIQWLKSIDLELAA